MEDPALLAHWPLGCDARDLCGRHHGTASGVGFDPQAQAARFDGGGVIRIDDHPALRLGSRPFTLTARVRCHTPVRGASGDIASKFDAQHRCGLNLTVNSSSAGYCGLGDTRHLYFGIDDGYLEPWHDCGRPGLGNSLVSSLAVWEGGLYAGIADAARPQDACRVYRWDDAGEWRDCGRLGPDPAMRSVQSLLVHEGALYAGSGCWDWVRAGGGEGFAAAPTRVFRYEGGHQWRDLGPVGDGRRVLTMASFKGAVHVGLDRLGGGRCFRLEGTSWADAGAPDGDNLECLAAHGGVLYGATHRNYYRYAGGDRWTCLARAPGGIQQTHCAQVYGGRLWLGTWPQGFVLRHEPPDEWVIAGTVGLPPGRRPCNEINDLTVYNGKLYAGVIPKAQVYRYDSDGHWALLRSLAGRPDWDEDAPDTWMRVTCMAAYRGRLYAGTGSCRGSADFVDPDASLGRIHSTQAGIVAAHEHDLGGGWHAIAAVRDEESLRLYVDGRLAHQPMRPHGFYPDLGNLEPLLIGSGPQGSFDGLIADVRLYGQALPPGQVASLATGAPIGRVRR